MISKVDAKLTKAKDTFNNEIQGATDDINNKIDRIDAYALEGFSQAKEERSKESTRINGVIADMREELSGSLSGQLEELREFVNSTTSTAQAHRETLQEKYNEKLTMIKEVCAKFFSKYEKHLLM